MQAAFRQYYDRSHQLNLRNPWYREQVERFLLGNLRSDVSSDLTSKKLIARSQRCQAVIRAKQSGTVAGVEEVTWLLRDAGLKVKIIVPDGGRVKPDRTILKLAGSARTILATERTALNALQHLSGIATTTRRMVETVGKSVQIAATRKTLWGGLDKRAVHYGSGLTHRLHLADGVMVKDNHLALTGHELLQRVRFGAGPLSLEVASFTELKRAVVHYPQFTILLLDNFSPERLRLAVHWLEQQKLRRRYCLEASGGITTENYLRYAKTGVDILSLGVLTHSVMALDISLDIIPL